MEEPVFPSHLCPPSREDSLAAEMWVCPQFFKKVVFKSGQQVWLPWAPVNALRLLLCQVIYISSRACTGLACSFFAEKNPNKTGSYLHKTSVTECLSRLVKSQRSCVHKQLFANIFSSQKKFIAQ